MGKHYRELFNPRTIAVVGANESEGFGGAACKNLLAYIDDPERIWFVNPKRDELHGKKCYHSIGEVQGEIDLAVIATNKKTVIPILKEGKERGLKAAVVFASGFSETGKEEDIALEEELVKTAEELDITLLGPNCAGFSNFRGGVNAFAFLSEHRDRKGTIGIISQSGMIGLSLNDNQHTRFSYNISCGNASCLSMPELIRFLADDPDTTVIGLYIDGIRDLDAFEEAVAYAKGKGMRIAVIKSGSNAMTRVLTKNHTGSVENFSNERFNALLKQYGITRCRDLEELIYTLCVYAYCDRLPAGNRVASVNLSGGEAALMGEVAEGFDLVFPEFTEGLKKYLEERLPAYAHVSNPLDMTAILSYDTEALSDALIHVMEEPEIDMILFGYTLLYHIDDPCIYYLTDALKTVREKLGDRAKPVFLVSFMSNTRNQEAVDRLRELGVVCLPTPYYAYRVLTGIDKG